MRTARALAVLAACALLAACASRPAKRPAPPSSGGATPARGHHDDTSRPQSERYRQDRDGGPDAPPIDVSKIPEPVPKVEPRARYGNKDPYSVLGKTYTLLPDASGYVERGIASWYGNKFHGYLTSSFEPYDMYAFSAAHKTLPLPSYARVTNLENGRSVIVRINDRGPFHENRLIDLSYAAAVKLGVWPKGTGLVEVRAIDPTRPELPPSRTAAAPAPARVPATRAVAALPSPVSAAVASPAPSPPVAPADAPRIYLQLGAFGERGNAERVVADAKRAGIDRVGIDSVAVAGRTMHRVRVGPLSDVEDADALSARIERLGLGAPRVAVEAAPR
jgi:rare lipoprotein A